MRLKDLLGKKSEPDVPTGRLITAADAHVFGAAPAPVAPHPPPLAHDPASCSETSPKQPSAAKAGLRTSAPDSLADAFARLLAAEQGEAPPPASPPPFPSLPPRLSDEDVERISARVAERFAEGPLRADVQRVVADVAERLVREEIARIRRAAESE